MSIDNIADLRCRIKASPNMAGETSCPACGSVAFRYPKVLADDKPVICAACGTFIATYGELSQCSDQHDQSKTSQSG
jgi:hypothetical protein